MTCKNHSKLQEDERRTIRESKKDFDIELGFLKAGSELFLKTFEVLSNEHYTRLTNSKDSTYRISYRIFRILRCVFNCSLEGYYDVSIALLRIAYENHLLMKYLSENENEAELWFRGKRFRPWLIRRKVSYSSDSLYNGMSEFIHSSFKSTLAFTEVETDKTKVVLGEYKKDRFREVLYLTLMTTATTLIWLSLTFAQELMQNEEWHSMFTNAVPKMWKHIGKTLNQGPQNRD